MAAEALAPLEIILLLFGLTLHAIELADQAQDGMGSAALGCNVPIGCSPALKSVNWTYQTTANRVRMRVNSHKNAKLTVRSREKWYSGCCMNQQQKWRLVVA